LQVLCSFSEPDFVGAWIRKKGTKTRLQNLRFEGSQTLDGKSNAVVTQAWYVSGGKIVGIGASRQTPADAQYRLWRCKLLPGSLTAPHSLDVPYSDDYKQQRLDTRRRPSLSARSGRQRQRPRDAMAGFTTYATRLSVISSRPSQRHPQWRRAGAAHACHGTRSWRQPAATATTRTATARASLATSQPARRRHQRPGSGRYAVRLDHKYGAT